MALLHGKMEVEMGIRIDATEFHDYFSCRPHHISNATPEKIQGVELHDGEWGKVGTTISWSYVHDGESKVAKEIIEEIDDEKNLTRFRVIDGDLMKLFKNFVIVVQSTAVEGGSVVRWTFEYERLNDEVAEPFTLMEFCVHVSRGIDTHHYESTTATKVTTPAAAAH